MFISDINPVLLKLGVFEIRYYGLAYVLGFLIAYFMLPYLARKRDVKLDSQLAADYIFYLMVGVIIGSRLGYVLLYDPIYYFLHPLEIFAVWLGGMSFHGGLAGSIIAGYLFSKKHKIDFYDIADITVIPLAIALFFGRVANFINGELYGKVTSVWWAVKFPGTEGFRHPSQLYEAAKNLVIFGVLWALKEKKMKKGMLFWLFVLMYGAMRFVIEFYRQGEIYFLPLSMGQWLCAGMVIVATCFIYKICKKSTK